MKESKEPDKIVKANPKHIEVVVKKIEEASKSLTTKFFDLGELLKEFRDGGYHLALGFKKFGEWIEKSGLDMSERAAYYLIKIIETGQQLKLPREKLENIKLSKLREIARLDVDKHEDKIRKLLKACTPDKDGEEMALDDVRENVQKILGGSEEIDVFVFMTIKVTKSTKEKVIDAAIEMCRAEYGDTVDTTTREAKEISIGRAIELICAEYLAGVHREEEASAELVPTEDQHATSSITGIELKSSDQVIADNVAKFADTRPLAEITDAERQTELPLSETLTTQCAEDDHADEASAEMDMAGKSIYPDRQGPVQETVFIPNLTSAKIMNNEERRDALEKVADKLFGLRYWDLTGEQQTQVINALDGE
jgi:hypothetical protein